VPDVKQSEKGDEEEATKEKLITMPKTTHMEMIRLTFKTMVHGVSTDRL